VPDQGVLALGWPEGATAESDVAMSQYRNLMWDLAVIFAVLSPFTLIMGYYSRRRFHALLKAPLNEEVEQETHDWEHRVRRWTILEFLVPGLSILSFIAWLVLSHLSAGVS